MLKIVHLCTEFVRLLPCHDFFPLYKMKQKYPRYESAALFDQAVLRVTSAPLSREHVSASVLASHN